jgi:ferredoxin
LLTTGVITTNKKDAKRKKQRISLLTAWQQPQRFSGRWRYRKRQMTIASLELTEEIVLRPQALNRILDFLINDKYRTIGPRIENGAIGLDEIQSVDDLPIGWRDVQTAGTYRLEKSNGNRLFGYVLGPQSWKKYLYPPNVRLWQGRRNKTGFKISSENPTAPPYAFFGVRPCELHAMSILDTVLDSRDFFDPVYALRRKKVFIVAVNCCLPGGNCFCVAMNTGPAAKTGYDIVLTEVQNPDAHFFIAGAGSNRGKKMLAAVGQRKATAEEIKMAEDAIAHATDQMARSVDPSHLRSIFSERFEHPRWNELAKKCLACGNCTLVCPTCFCHTVEDSTSLSGDTTERWRRWDSCFTQDFSYMHGGSVRSSVKSRYRQWLTHKLSTWVEQFGTSGCVGCGRCITWCPVGIDIRQEANTILQA